MSEREVELIEWLGAAASGPEAIGGKAASLDRLLKLGYRVPPGFCVTTTAFRAQRDGGAFLPGAALEPAIDGSLRRAVTDLVAAMHAALSGAPTFAVRSSAIGEDGSAASYAGLHETELGVDPQDVPGSVQRCWASLWSAPAVAYRQRRGLEEADAAMAVVVQALVPAEASAVVFTRHPVTDRDDQLVVTATRGLGDAMVAGTITPDTYVIDRATRSVASFDPGDGAGSDGPGDGPGGAAVDAAQLAELVELCLRVEADFGRAVDIEAARARDGWYLLQARPITTGAAGEIPR